MKYLFVSHFSGIWVHSYPEALVADTLMKAGHEIKFLFCNRLFNVHCTTMSAFRVGENDPLEKKEAICQECITNSKILKDNFKFESFINTDFITEADKYEIDNLLKKVTIKNFETIYYKGVNIGKSSLYETLIRYKKKSLNFHKTEFEYYKTYLRNALLSLNSFSKVIESYNPDAVVFIQMNMLQIWVLLYIHKIGVFSSYTMFAGMNIPNSLKTLVILKGSYWDLKRAIRKRWGEKKKIFL
ncbi:MAG: hypothetical protein IPL26_13540 [Leptospiraceae bacterium]|nr:hypothetical protein [Leptospiraceae bacterium]